MSHHNCVQLTSPHLVRQCQGQWIGDESTIKVPDIFFNFLFGFSRFEVPSLRYTVWNLGAFVIKGSVHDSNTTTRGREGHQLAAGTGTGTAVFRSSGSSQGYALRFPTAGPRLTSLRTEPERNSPLPHLLEHLTQLNQIQIGHEIRTIQLLHTSQ